MRLPALLRKYIPFSADMHICECCLLPAQKEGMAGELEELLANQNTPFSPAGQSSADRKIQDKEIAGILQRWLPEDMVKHIRRHAKGKSDMPLLIKNLPESSKHYGPFIARGIYTLMGIDWVGPQMLQRTAGDKSWAGRGIHQDPEEISMLSAPHNDIKAATLFVDFEASAAKLSTTEQKRISLYLVTPGQHTVMDKYATTTPSRITLHQYLTMPATDRKSLAFEGIAMDEALSDASALQKLKTTLEKESKKVTLEPGDLLIWPNRRVYHQALEGIVEIEHNEPSRIAYGVFSRA